MMFGSKAEVPNETIVWAMFIQGKTSLQPDRLTLHHINSREGDVTVFLDQIVAVDFRHATRFRNGYFRFRTAAKRYKRTFTWSMNDSIEAFVDYTFRQMEKRNHA